MTGLLIKVGITWIAADALVVIALMVHAWVVGKPHGWFLWREDWDPDMDPEDPRRVDSRSGSWPVV